MKTEQQIYDEIVAYINSGKHNRPCTLQTIKKEQRTEKIVNLVFSHPSVFQLENEIKHVPAELKTDKILMKYVLYHPYCLNHLTEEEQTLPVLIAFEFSKRRYERISAMLWGSSRERIPYYGKSQDCRKQLHEIVDKLSLEVSEKPTPEEIVNKIQEHCSNAQMIATREVPYTCKYDNVNFNTDKRVVILISGHPDSGKTTFGNILKTRINNSISFDSDILLQNNLLDVSFGELAGDKKVVIFSDLDADRFFSSKELENCYVINVYIKPESVGEMYRNSKYMRHLSFEDYVNRFQQESKVDESRFKDAIHVINTYDNNILKEVDRVIEIISGQLESDSENSQ